MSATRSSEPEVDVSDGKHTDPARSWRGSLTLSPQCNAAEASVSESICAAVRRDAV